jgi:hypothetical protein
MREIEVIGTVILSDTISVERVDLPNKTEDDISRLRDMGINKEKIDKIDINKGTDDIFGEYNREGESVGFEAKGTTKKNYGNFKYWGKGMLSQMAQLDDNTISESVGIAIPKEVASVLRGIMSSYNSTVSSEKAQNKAASQIYGERQASVLRMYDQDDYIVLADKNGIEVQRFEEFFGL